MAGNRNLLMLLTILFVSLVLIASKSNLGFANTDNVTVNVTVAALTEITVTPSNLTWVGIFPGTVGGQYNVSIQNTGSANASNLYAYVTTIHNETERPYGSSTAEGYSAGGVLVFRNESNTNYFWAGRLEWNWTETISSKDPGINPHSFRAEGFFRNTSLQYYWAAGNGTISQLTNGCNNTNALFAIEDDYDNGTLETRTADITSITRDGGDANWSYFRVTRASNFLNGMCVAVHFNCTRAFVYNFDKRSSGGFSGSTCTESDFITAGPLAPNDIERVTADVWMPKGIPAGFMKVATWTFVVS